MKETYNKAELVKIFTETHREYVDSRHSAVPKDCGLCRTFKLGMDEEGRTIAYVGNSCENCPMFAFDSRLLRDGCQGYPCVDRLCKPVHCCSNMDDSDLFHLRLVTEFYKRLVEVVENIDGETISRDILFETIRNLDKEVWDDINHGDFNEWIKKD